MNPEIVYANEKFFASFRETLDIVARERIYIEMIEAPPLEKVAEFHRKLIAQGGPAYFAVAGDRVVGWCDAFPERDFKHKHRSCLGMGIVPEFRGKGLGAKLMTAVLDHATRTGVEKMELKVNTANTRAIALYKKFGFEQEGLIKKYRKVDGRYFDCMLMGKAL
jgi:RimJ/RimL family protein N-acetyltransferase